MKLNELENKVVSTDEITSLYDENKETLKEMVLTAIRRGDDTESDNFTDFFDELLRPVFDKTYYIHRSKGVLINPDGMTDTDHFTEKRSITTEIAFLLRREMLNEGSVTEVDVTEDTWKYDAKSTC